MTSRSHPFTANIKIMFLYFENFIKTSKNIKTRIYEIIILSLVLYACESRSLTLKEEHILRVSEKRVLRTFGPNKIEVRGWRKLHNDELRNFYSSPGVIRMIKSRRMR
jgi:hypothetical protein